MELTWQQDIDNYDAGMPEPPEITRQRVAWVHPYDRHGQARITHPWQWSYVDADGTERMFDTRRDALEHWEASQDS